MHTSSHIHIQQKNIIEALQLPVHPKRSEYSLVPFNIERKNQFKRANFHEYSECKDVFKFIGQIPKRAFIE